MKNNITIREFPEKTGQAVAKNKLNTWNSHNELSDTQGNDNMEEPCDL